MATYKLSNFLATPSSSDTRLRIYDKSSNLKYTIEPNIAVFYKKANMVLIKMESKNDIYLDFATTVESAQALSKLNSAKKALLQTPVIVNNSASKSSVLSKSNLKMSANVTIMDGDLATDNAIVDTPIYSSHVRVFINGVEVNVGGKYHPNDCYFSPDGINVRVLGDEKKGDKLYWNSSVAGYDLDEKDIIDFVYNIEIV